MNRGSNRLLLGILIILVLCYIVFDDLVQGDWVKSMVHGVVFTVFVSDDLWPPEWGMLTVLTTTVAVKNRRCSVQRHLWVC